MFNKQDGVLVGSRLGNDMFSSSTKMLKVILEAAQKISQQSLLSLSGWMEWLRSQSWGNPPLLVVLQGSNSRIWHFVFGVAFKIKRNILQNLQNLKKKYIAWILCIFVQKFSSARETTRFSSSLFQLQPFTLSTTHRLLPTAVGMSQHLKLAALDL